MFKTSAGRYPTTGEGLEALLTKPDGLEDKEWDGPYLKEWPKDAWNEDFIYSSRGKDHAEFDIISKGPDKKAGTDDDIMNADSD